jgi:hypothetical protein
VKNNYGFDAFLNKIDLSAGALWTEFQHGEGELEIGNQGRSQNSTKSFSQETGAIGQKTPRIGEIRPKRREYSAGCANNSDSTPHLFSHHMRSR